MFLSIILAILILGLLVLVHEFGHFIVAKKSGMSVQEFGIGFPPRLWSRRKGETLYSINVVPLGGFVKILGENNDSAEDPRSFINKPFLPRLLTLTAGVLMNFILAWVLLSVGLGIGLPTVVSEGQSLPAHATLKNPQISILDVADASPAAKAGMQAGDAIISLDHQNFNSIESISAYVKSQAGKNVDFQLKRGKEFLDYKVLARPNPPAGEGATGIALGQVGNLSFPWYIAPVVGLKATGEIIRETFDGFVALFAHGQGLSHLGGPIRIAALTNQVSQLGLVYVIQFIAFLSVNLGILNIVPFPALDGGRVLFLLIEKIRGKRNNQNIEGIANTLGFAVLIALILFISFRDVSFLIHK
jgi:regulator of sigma E protease